MPSEKSAASSSATALAPEQAPSTPLRSVSGAAASAPPVAERNLPRTNPKIEAAMAKVGGRFRLTVLIQKRIRELHRGAPKLVECTSPDLLDVVLEEILQDKISLAKREELA